ncbi:MAG: hypothetical protein D6731_13800 [Planctomycetota bacterium]|nr:MAG: hypothetical protein D6731_13800 [Planctomycetota bacterium]
MRRRGPIACAAVLLPALLWAQGKDGDSFPYLPLRPGCRWTYHLLMEAKGERATVVVTSEVVRREEVEGIGPCAVVVSRSAEKLLNTTWYAAQDGKLTNPRYRGGKPHDPVLRFEGRVLLDLAALEGFTGEEPPAEKPRWAWTCSDGNRGEVVLDRRERLYLPKVGDLRDCLVLVERSHRYRGQGEARERVRTFERTIWLARGLGVVKEVLRVLGPDGASVVFRSEAVLTQFQEP